MSHQYKAVAIVIYTLFKPTSQVEEDLDSGGIATGHSDVTTGNIFVWIKALVEFDLIPSEYF